ncbi:NAD(P)-dependent oxidoreductase [Acidicapsa ligni]|uniref:NAD(P)-dependent oxidoreductase n=1 Tax=Acidicapsa ligni TaxID=542300 RepID=UPI0021E00EFA|nr:NAD(P)-dependent oxidoreductase [Acidicapsa ligni]
MSKVAFIGLGAMGSRMAFNLLKAGHDLTVWNRRPEAAESLVASGAKAAKTPREAAEGNDFVIAIVSNDEASRQVWLDPIDGALAGMKKGAIAIESSTLTPAWVLELAEATSKAGVTLLDAMVSGSTPQAQSAQLVFLVGGDSDSLESAKPLLKSMGSSIQHAGPVGCGALAKLATNTLMGVGLAALAELIGMLKRQGADPRKVLDAVSATTVWSAHLTRDAGSMLAGDFETRFPINLLTKDLGYALKAGGGEESMPTASAVHGVFQKAIAEDLGNLNMTAVVKLFDKEQ